MALSLTAKNIERIYESGSVTRDKDSNKNLKNFRMARPERFELPTPRFEAWCSIQLSYGRFRIDYKKKHVQTPDELVR